MTNPEFNKLIAKRNLTVTELAKLAMCGRAHLVQVLGGTRAGKYTWNRLARVLTHEEFELAERLARERAAMLAGQKKLLENPIAQQ